MASSPEILDLREPPHVLLVEDSPTTRTLYAKSLGKYGCRVEVAANGFEALAALEVQVHDVILLDYEMPGMNGIEVLQAIRDNPRTTSVPVYLVTAEVEHEALIQQAFDLGVTDFITKPMNAAVLSERIKRLVLEDRTPSGRRRGPDSLMLRAEMTGAEELQYGLLPATPLTRDGWNVDGAVVPSTRVGGDIFDVIELPQNEWCTALIDISGHGLAAGMVAASVRAVLRVLLRTHPFEEALERLNFELLSSEQVHYACICLVKLEGDEVVVFNAGLPPVALLSNDEPIVELGGSGPPPGLIENAKYEVFRAPLAGIQRIAMATDGLTEPFGAAHRIRPYLYHLGLLGPKNELLGSWELRIRRMLAGIDREQRDDATLVVLERLEGLD